MPPGALCRYRWSGEAGIVATLISILPELFGRSGWRIYLRPARWLRYLRWPHQRQFQTASISLAARTRSTWPLRRNAPAAIVSPGRTPRRRKEPVEVAGRFRPDWPFPNPIAVR